MKKKQLIIALLISVLSFGSAIFAQKSPTNYFISGRKLISLDLEKNSELIKEISYRLDVDQRQELYDIYAIDFTSAMLKNGFFGFGIGSDRQGDTGGRKIALSLELSGLGVVAGTLIFYSLGQNSIPEFKDPENKLDSIILFSGIIAGAGIFLGGRIFSIIRPYVYASNHNNLLKTVLRLSENDELAFMPLVNPVDKEFGFVAQIRL